MPRILVPVDFTPTSLNAAQYAAHMGKAIGASSVTLLSVVSSVNTGSDGTPVADDMVDRNRAIIENLEMVQVSLYNEAGVRTEIVVEQGDFSDLMPKYIRDHKFDFVVMGVTGSNALEQVFGTSNAVEVIARSATPVVVVPPNAYFKEIKHVALAVELHNLDDLVPLKELEQWLTWLHPKVHIAHVNQHSKPILTEEENEELNKLKDILILRQPETHLLHGEKFTDALNHMAIDNKIDLMFTFPQKHSFFNLLFRNTHTRQLVFHSMVPIIALPHN
jgi:nucleotide-binding universal stress UspA family protein